MSRKGSTPIALSQSARITGVLATVVILAVVIGTALIVSPSGTPLRAEVRSAAMPYFTQSWRVFAPNIIKVNRTLEFRAQWRNDAGELVRSDWVPLTEIEQATISGNVATTRMSKSTWNASGTYLTRYNALNSEQRTRVRDTFITSDGEGGFRPIPSEDLIAEMGPGDGDVVRFLRMDYMLMRHTTLFATAGFGERIERVQWRVVRERPNDFQNRFREDEQFPLRTTTLGWRHSNVRIDDSVIEAYRSLIERHGAQHIFDKAAADADQ